jgi:hypothetical protein
LANQTVTWSFWAKAAATTSVVVIVDQDFGSGGSSRVFNAIASQTISVGTSWQRFTYTGTMASVSGKTIGTSSFVDFTIRMPSNATFTVDIWGLQVEAGSVATAFQTATGTIQGELAACQRYYVQWGGESAYVPIGNGVAATTTVAYINVIQPVEMRVIPSAINFSSLAISETLGTFVSATPTLTTNFLGKKQSIITATVASGLTANRPMMLVTDNSTSGYLGLSAEL